MRDDPQPIVEPVLIDIQLDAFELRALRFVAAMSREWIMEQLGDEAVSSVPGKKVIALDSALMKLELALTTAREPI